MSNMVPEAPEGPRRDELADLRADFERRVGDPGQGRVDLGERSPGREREERQVKKRSRGRKKKKDKLKVDGKKDLKLLFQDTGVDPDPVVRRRFKRRATKLSRRKGKDVSNSSSSATTSTSTLGQEDAGIFGGVGKVQRIGRKLPGVLTLGALEEASEALITQEGGLFETGAAALPPLFLRYYRMQLASRMSPAMGREAHTLSQILDSLLRGRVAEGMDIGAQRLKSLEMMAQGAHWTVSQQQELLPREGASMSTTTEFQLASRQAREEGKAKLDATRPYGARGSSSGKGEEWTKGSGKKGGGKYKGQKGDGKKSEQDKGDAKKAKAG
jgi:hypothetical protein